MGVLSGCGGGDACSSETRPDNPCKVTCGGHEGFVKNVNGGTSCCSAWTNSDLHNCLCDPGPCTASQSGMCTMISSCKGCTAFWPSQMEDLVHYYKAQCGSDVAATISSSNTPVQELLKEVFSKAPMENEKK